MSREVITWWWAISTVTLLTILAVGCAQGSCARDRAAWRGYAKLCVDGVSYLQFTSGATVQLDKEGRPVACK